MVDTCNVRGCSARSTREREDQHHNVVDVCTSHAEAIDDHPERFRTVFKRELIETKEHTP